ncbi:ester cyclase [Isoptericola haloaureus]|uniref:Ester cyclase n=1 Tax=Isoptericola haloaureus TaxID=1542902 RepID=A0ABU7Z9T6_9MICO
MRAVFDHGWNEQRFEALAPTLGTFALHVEGRSRTTDLAELEAIVGAWHEAFDGLRFAVHAVTASDDVAAVHATLHGTHRGPWQGLAPTGRSIEVEHMFFFRFAGERITDVWEMLDRPAMAAQLEG